MKPPKLVGHGERRRAFTHAHPDAAALPLRVPDLAGEEGPRRDTARAQGARVRRGPTARRDQGPQDTGLVFDVDIVTDHATGASARGDGRTARHGVHALSRPGVRRVPGDGAPPRGVVPRSVPGAAQDRAPPLNGFKYLDVEVHVEASRLKSATEVRSLFMESHVSLQTTLSVAQLNCYVGLFLAHPTPTACVAYLGRQTDQRTFVAGNCCFKEGQIMTHAEAGYEIIPEFFAEHLTPLTRRDFPRHMLIPFPHVRYLITTRIWNELMPAFFKNNLLPAQATFAMAVMGLQTTKVWAGQTGLGHGCPTAWVFSSEPNTGKTEATLLCQSMFGFFHRGARLGGSRGVPATSSKSSIMRSTSLSSHSSMPITLRRSSAAETVPPACGRADGG